MLRRFISSTQNDACSAAEIGCISSIVYRMSLFPCKESAEILLILRITRSDIETRSTAGSQFPQFRSRVVLGKRGWISYYRKLLTLNYQWQEFGGKEVRRLDEFETLSLRHICTKVMCKKIRVYQLLKGKKLLTGYNLLLEGLQDKLYSIVRWAQRKIAKYVGQKLWL